MRLAKETVCIVVVCADDEADQISRQLPEVNARCLITYRRVEDLVFNAPTGEVALVILAANDDPATTQRTLKWLRHRWPGCPISVVSQTGGEEHEMSARKGGAMYLTRPVEPKQWSAMVSEVLGRPHRAGSGRRSNMAAESDDQ